jgi:3'-phosphoadenosine 5'-phosphosulfate (PAPS) 3'-phosphatase
MKPLNKNADLKIAVSPNQISSKQFKGILDKNFLNFTTIPHFTPKILAIINGEVNAAIYLPQTGKYASLWDYAAASLVLHELGGKLKSMSGKDMNFSGNRVIHTDGWIATDSSKNNAFLSSLFRNICLE